MWPHADTKPGPSGGEDDTQIRVCSALPSATVGGPSQHLLQSSLLLDFTRRRSTGIERNKPSQGTPSSCVSVLCLWERAASSTAHHSLYHIPFTGEQNAWFHGERNRFGSAVTQNPQNDQSSTFWHLQTGIRRPNTGTQRMLDLCSQPRARKGNKNPMIDLYEEMIWREVDLMLFTRRFWTIYWVLNN